MGVLRRWGNYCEGAVIITWHLSPANEKIVHKWCVQGHALLRTCVRIIRHYGGDGGTDGCDCGVRVRWYLHINMHCFLHKGIQVRVVLPQILYSCLNFSKK